MHRKLQAFRKVIKIQKKSAAVANRTRQPSGYGLLNTERQRLSRQSDDLLKIGVTVQAV